MMSVKFLNLKPNKQLQAELDEAYKGVMSSGRYIGGYEVEVFEQEWAEYCNADYCIGVSSGQTALELLLKSFGVGYGDNVIVPSWTAVATWKAVLNVGASLLPVDVDYETMLLEPSEQLNKTKSLYIMPVHLYGYRAFANHIRVVIQDACQAHGLQNVSTAAFSFYPTKNLGAYGDGGAIITNSKQVYNRIKAIQDSSRLDPLQAAFLRVKLKYLDSYNYIRAENARIYNEHLTDKVKKPPEGGLYHQYVIRLDKRDELKRQLAGKGIETMIHYPVPPHRQLGFDFDLPVADRLAGEVLSLPIMTSKENVYRVIEAVNELTQTS